jgi:chemotaxis protein methyltransferase CheR
MGLHFPPERMTDLQRSVAAAAEEFGFGEATTCVDWLLATPLTEARLQVLATHLTIGETYFFREKKTLDILASHVLPELIRARRGRAQRLRLWSAACCSGEEAYSLAILLQQILPDLADWQVTILATDINPRVLRKAVAGSYGEWSFRETPAGFKERYFTRTGDRRYTIRPEIAKLVTFEHRNLVDDVSSSLATDTNAMDVILCRNVLMYFTPAQTRKVIASLHESLIDGGWLAASPSESSQQLFPEFVTRNFPGAILYQKSRADWRPALASAPASSPAITSAATATATPAWAPAPQPVPLTTAPPAADTRSTPYALAAALYEQGRYGEAAEMLLAVAGGPKGSEACSLLARALANQGRLAEALGWCDRWIAADKADAAGHYLRGVVLLEQGDPDEARRALQRVLYLDPSFVLAHFALGNLARRRGQHDEADRQFGNTLRLLRRLAPGDRLPESDGLTAGRLTQTITALTAAEPTR